jgi:outer membrane protein OmpA-like peptidoglycan-associated protein
MRNPFAFEVEPFGSELTGEHERGMPESHREAALLAEVGRRRGSFPRPRPSPSYGRPRARGRWRWPRPRPCPPFIVVPPRWPGPMGWQYPSASFPGDAGGVPDTADVASLDCRRTVVLDGFDVSDSRLRPNHHATLVRIAQELRDLRQPNTVLNVTGHSDGTRTEIMNRGLSLNRALEVVRFLSSLGVAGETMIRPMSDSRPVAPNTTAEGRRKNRRVVIQLCHRSRRLRSSPE